MKLDDLVDMVVLPDRPNTCWRTRLEGDALKLVELVEDRNPDPPRAALQKALAQLGVPVGKTSIVSHYTGGCRCRIYQT